MNKQIKIGGYKADGFIQNYQKLVNDTVIPYQYTVLCDEAENVEKSHVVQNFINAGKYLRDEDIGDGFYGMVFQDSDAGKWLEAAAYTLTNYPDEKLMNKADVLIDLIGQAQDEDGYLNTAFTVKDRERRWTNLLEGHELYCAGHLMEAACAYYEATGKDKLLRIMEKNAGHIYRHFITEKTEGYPGHPEIELALMRMYDTTGNRHCLELAEHFINVRGVDKDYYKKECAKRDWTVWGNNAEDVYYQQNYAPVREQKDAVGHAVRAVYLYTGMAHLAAQTKDEGLISACRSLWDSITERRMYITGGIGSTVNGEAFTVDYDLPSDTAYAETCASVGLMFFASQMIKSDIDGKYADVMERAFYNTVLAGMQLDGKRFFYVNPLEIVPGISGKASTHWHTLTTRPGWYACACCPPNAARLIASLGRFAYGENEDTAFCHMFAAGNVSFENGMKLTCETDYPYDFTVKYTIEKGGRLAVRIPEWCDEFTLTQNGYRLEAAPEKGYVYLNAADGDVFEFVFGCKPKFIYANEKVHELTGMAAVSCGPLVYAFEGADNDGDVLSLTIDTSSEPVLNPMDKALLNGVRTVEVSGFRRSAGNSLYSSKKPVQTKCTLRAIPYYAWGNRGENQMRVWLPYV